VESKETELKKKNLEWGEVERDNLKKRKKSKGFENTVDDKLSSNWPVATSFDSSY